MRVVFDTNTIISAILLKNSVPATAFDFCLQKATFLTSEQTAVELSSVLLRSKFDRYVSLNFRQDFIAAYLRTAELVKIKSSINICRDVSDNKFLELAVDGNADYIITGDNDLLQIEVYQSIPILQAAGFIKLVSPN